MTYALYYFPSCPFCQRVLVHARRAGIELDLRDIQRDRQHLSDLMAARGRRVVPVLRFERDGEDVWMPESADIMRYLDEVAAALR